MKQYLDLLAHVMENGVDRGDRTGVGTRSVFGHQMRFDLQQGFPLLTTKKFTESVVHELLWFYPGRRMLHICKKTACASGTSGQHPKAN